MGEHSSATLDVGETPSPAMLNVKALASPAFPALQMRLFRLSDLGWCDGDAPKQKDNHFCHEAPKKDYEYIAFVGIRIIASGCFVKHDPYKKVQLAATPAHPSRNQKKPP